MAKKIEKQFKVLAPGGQATPAPPVGTALGPHGVNIGQFVQQFNDRTREMNGTIVPVVITVYSDRSFTFVTKTPPASILIKKALNLKSGSPTPNTKKVGVIKKEQLEEIAKTKWPDLNAGDMDAAIRIIAGSARSMGVDVEGI